MRNLNASLRPVGYEAHPDRELQDLLDYWSGVERAAKTGHQRDRAEAKLKDIAGEMRYRGIGENPAERRARAGFMS